MYIIYTYIKVVEYFCRSGELVVLFRFGCHGKLGDT